MKEDKLDMEIAASLKKKLVDATVPYELGAWEGFQKKRVLQKRKKIAAWATGIAASLLLLAVGLNSIDFTESDTTDSTAIQLTESTKKSPENSVEEFLVTESDTVAGTSPAEVVVEPKSNTTTPDSKILEKSTKDAKPQLNNIDTKALASVPEPVEMPEKVEEAAVSPEFPIISGEKIVAQEVEKPNTEQKPLITSPEEIEKPLMEKAPEKILALTEEKEPVKLAEEEKFVAESDFPVIEKDKATVGLGMGVSPGFGAVQNDNQVATASTIGLGMLVDIKLPGKLILGSGLGVNYFSQSAKQESVVMAFENVYPQTEKLEVRQMQVEMPVFVKYPVTKNNSISVQAGFSNVYAVNGTASQENIVPMQVAVYNSDALGFSSLSMKQQAVTENSTLESKSGKFYPFATLNFGVNLQVLETKGANFVIMPFYNHQLKQVSGYGDTYGLFGASFKMNFGGGEK